MVALAILGLLVGLAVANLGGIFKGAQTKTAKLFVATAMETPLTTYKIDLGDYPSTEEGLAALWTAPASKADRWHGPYASGKMDLSDPWGHPYHYVYPGVHNKGGFDLWSSGPDGQDGTDDDITNW